MSEADILFHLVAPDRPGLSAESARALLQLEFDETATARMNELAEKNRQGTLTESEHVEMGRYTRVGNFLNLVQAKARTSLTELDGPER